MAADPLEKLIEKTKNDPQFFHDLIWDTEKVLSTTDFLTRQEKAAFLAINPENLIVGLATGSFGGRISDHHNNCGASGGDSCGASCGGSCGVSCEASCATTCATSHLLEDIGDAVSNPALAQHIFEQVGVGLKTAAFGQFTR